MNLLQTLDRLIKAVPWFRKGKAHDSGFLEELQGVIGYRFRSTELLKQGLTHKSSTCPEDPLGLLSNERLEFLGDGRGGQVG